MFSSYEEIVKNWGIAVNSMGFTDKQVATQMDSISRRLKTLKADLVGLAEQGANGGLTATIKDAITSLDHMIKFLDGIPAEVYGMAGSFTKLALQIYVVNKALSVAKTRVVAMGIAAGSIKAAEAATIGFTAAVEALGLSFKRLWATVRVIAAKSVVGLAWVAAGEALGYLVEKLSDYNAELDKSKEAEQNEYAIKEQQIEQYNKQIEFTSSLLNAHTKITDAINNENTTSEKKVQLQKDLEVTEEELTNVLGDAAVERLKQDGWTRESIEAVKKEYVESVHQKQEALAKWMQAKISESLKIREQAENNIKSYNAEAEAFINGTEEKIEAISALAGAQVAYYKLKAELDNAEYEGAKTDLEANEKRRKEIADDIKNGNDSEENLRLYNSVAERSDGLKEDMAKYAQARHDDRNDLFYAAYGEQARKAQADIANADKILGGITNNALNSLPSTNDMTKPWGGNAPGGDIDSSTDKPLKSAGSSSSSTPKESPEPIGLSPEGGTWIREGGVNIEDNTDRAKAMLTQAAQWYYDQTGEQLNVTSGYRDWGGHTNGEKMDYATDSLEGNAELRRMFIAYLQSIGAGAVDEYSHPSSGATGGHIDVDATGYNWYTGEELGGVSTMTSGKTTKPTKSINDFHKSKYAYDEFQRQQELERESYERTKNSIANYEKINGTTFTSAIMTQQNEEGKLVSDEAALNMAKRIQGNIEAQINAYIEQHPEISDMLAGQGTTWDALIPQEKQAIADLAGDNGGIKDLLSKQEQARQSVEKLTTDYENQKVSVDKLHGSMTPDERHEYNAKNIDNAYDISIANTGNDKSFGAEKARKNAQIDRLKAQMDEANAKLKEAKANYDGLLGKGMGGSLAGMKAKQQVDELTASVKKLGNQLEEVADENLTSVKEKASDVLSDLIVEGKSFADVWKSLVNDLAKYAIRAAFGLSNKGSWLNGLFGLNGGGSVEGKANGGKFADGGAVRGAGTGRSDSILAYLANKDKFVYLSNGEYVMTEEATKRIGVDNLDALNGYADGGALSPTPYVASINPVTAKKATSISDNGDTVALLKEQNAKMAEQLTLLKGMGKDGSNGDLVVLNTQASSADVLKALQENPRAVQALMGQQRRAGFR